MTQKFYPVYFAPPPPQVLQINPILLQINSLLLGIDFHLLKINPQAALVK